MASYVRAVMSVFTSSMDFKGQSDAERLYQWVIGVPTVAGFAHGYAVGSFDVTFWWWAAGAAAAALLTIPVWPLWTRNQIRWLDEREGGSEGRGKGGKGARGADAAGKAAKR